MFETLAKKEQELHSLLEFLDVNGVYYEDDEEVMNAFLDQVNELKDVIYHLKTQE